MVLNLKNVAKYAKICDRLKDDSQPVFDSALLDFENAAVMFGSQKGFGRIKMEVEGWDGKRKPFFVNMNSLLNVVKEFPVLELEGRKFKHGDDGEFEIAHLEDEERFPDFINSGSASPVKIDGKALAAFRKCGLFVDVDGHASLNGVFIKNGHVWGTNKNRLCEEYVESLADVEMALPRIVWETLVMDVLGEDLVIDKDENSFFIASGDEIKIQFALSYSLSSPDIHNPNFAARFDHPNHIILDKAELLGVVNFIQPFVSSTSSQRVQFIIWGDVLEVKSADNGNIISRKIPVKEKAGSLEEGGKVWVSANWIKTILSVLGGDAVKIQVDLSKPALNISCAGEPQAHVVYCRLMEAV